MHPNTEGILESSLYVTDLARSVSFYKKIFGFEVIGDFGERGCAMKAGKRHVLLLFKKGGSLNIVSPHDGDGQLHLAFAIGADELTRWEAWLAENKIAVEETQAWKLLVTAFISVTQTGTSSRLLHPESGQFIDAVAPSQLSRGITVTEVPAA